MKQVRVRAGPELDSPRLSVLGGGEIITVLETWQSREGQLRVRCDAGWTSIYSKDGQTRLLQRMTAGSRSPPSAGRLHSARGSSSPRADAESSAYSESPARSRSPAVPIQTSPGRASLASSDEGYIAELQSPIRTGVPLPMDADSSSSAKLGQPNVTANAAFVSPRASSDLVLEEVDAEELAASDLDNTVPPLSGADASLVGSSSPTRGQGTPEIPLPSTAAPSATATTTQLPPPLSTP